MSLEAATLRSRSGVADGALSETHSAATPMAAILVRCQIIMSSLQRLSFATV
jgi:hypothetical protein